MGWGGGTESVSEQKEKRLTGGGEEGTWLKAGVGEDCWGVRKREGALGSFRVWSKGCV